MQPVIVVNKKNRNSKQQPVAITVQGGPSVKTLRNRRRRQKRRQSVQAQSRATVGGGNQSVINRRTLIDSFMYLEGSTMRKSVHDLMQNLFAPTHGLHRGTASGTELTALTRFKQSTVLTVPANAVLTYAFIPDRITSNEGFAAYIKSTAVLPHVTNPFIAEVPGGYVREYIPGPFFGTNPSNDAWRVVSFQLKIVNITASLSAAGAHVMAYHPRLVNQFGGVDQQVFTADGVDQLEWSVPQPNTVSMICNWVPNSNETMVTAEAIPNSGVLGYISGAAAITQYRFEWDIGIEYAPSVAYRPYVDRHVPEVHPDAWFYVNKELGSGWDRWVIMPYEAYLKKLDGIESLNPSTVALQRLNKMGSYGTGGLVTDADAFDEYADLKAKQSSWINVEKVGQMAKAVGQAVQDTACYLDPNSVLCDPRAAVSRTMGIGQY